LNDFCPIVSLLSENDTGFVRKGLGLENKMKKEIELGKIKQKIVFWDHGEEIKLKIN
jgi:hypothetical protein